MEPDRLPCRLGLLNTFPDLPRDDLDFALQCWRDMNLYTVVAWHFIDRTRHGGNASEYISLDAGE